MLTNNAETFTYTNNISLFYCYALSFIIYIQNVLPLSLISPCFAILHLVLEYILNSGKNSLSIINNLVTNNAKTVKYTNHISMFYCYALSFIIYIQNVLSFQQMKMLYFRYWKLKMFKIIEQLDLYISDNTLNIIEDILK